jgi:hypothetical protein
VQYWARDLPSEGLPTHQLKRILTATFFVIRRSDFVIARL